MKKHMTEEERIEYERSQAALRGTGGKKKWFRSMGLAVPFIVITICLAAFAGAMLYRSNSLVVTQDQAAQAKDVLRAAAGAADSFAADNSGSYSSMSAADLGKLETRYKWVDGAPGVGQLGVTDIGAATYTIVYMNGSGVEYRLVRDEQGIVSYLTADGQPL
jgi:hypothetical protein